MRNRLQKFVSVNLGLFYMGTTIGFWSALALNPLPVLAGAGNYEECAEDLLEIGIDLETITIACSEALRPQNIGDCAFEIDYVTNLNAVDILEACRTVRRPVELGQCVEEIHDEIPTIDSQLVLNTCQQSLLPKQLADCTLGLHEELPLSAEELLVTCSQGDSQLYEFFRTN